MYRLIARQGFILLFLFTCIHVHLSFPSSFSLIYATTMLALDSMPRLCLLWIPSIPVYMALCALRPHPLLEKIDSSLALAFSMRWIGFRTLALLVSTI